MSFEKLEVRAPAGKRALPASIALSDRGNTGRPKTFLSLKAEIAEQAGFTEKTTFSVYIGRDDDAGRLRVAADDKGIISAKWLHRKGGGAFTACAFDLGYIASVGSSRADRTPTEARIISPGVVDVDIPDFSGGAVGGTEADDGTQAVGGGAEKSSANEIFLNGITIDLTPDEESVTFDGEGVVVSSLEANLVAILARPRPAPVAETFIIKNLWDGHAPKNASEVLRQLCVGDLKKGLSTIGLNLAPVKGVGYQLKDA